MTNQTLWEKGLQMLAKTLSLVLACSATLGIRALRSCDDVAKGVSRHSQKTLDSVPDQDIFPLHSRKTDSAAQKDDPSVFNGMMLNFGSRAATRNFFHDACSPQRETPSDQYDTLDNGGQAGVLPCRTLLRSDLKIGE